jgi:phosphinothricin acetyltransferase
LASQREQDAVAHPGPSAPPDGRGSPAPLRLRDAALADAPAIARILNQGIEESTSTLETEPKTAAEREAWLATRGPRHPVIVAVDEAGRIRGWGSLNPFKSRTVYDHVADFSVYVARDARGTGIGTLMLAELERRARAIGYHKMVLAAMPENLAGRRLYTRYGFTVVGTYREQGFRDGVWRDVLLMEKILG